MLFEVGVLEFGVGVIRSLRFGSFFFCGGFRNSFRHSSYDIRLFSANSPLALFAPHFFPPPGKHLGD